jgi:hypothetical protein
MKLHLFIFAFLSLLFSCKSKNGTVDNPAIARVDGNYLYQADLTELYQPGMSHQDSTNVTQLYVQNWIRDQLLLSRANDYVSSNAQIEKLVTDYRHSLITQLYAEALIKERLDSTISIKQYEEHYKNQEDRHKLDESIVRCFFLRIPNDLPGAGQMGIWFKSKDGIDYDRLSKICSELDGKIYYNLDEKKWIHLENISAMLPGQTLPPQYLSGTQDFVTADGDFTYLMRVFEFAPAGSSAPLSYVMKDIAEVVLHQRKLDLMDKLGQELYQEARNSNRIETYFKN